jgi:hypothetical protein
MRFIEVVGPTLASPIFMNADQGTLGHSLTLVFHFKE